MQASMYARDIGGKSNKKKSAMPATIEEETDNFTEISNVRMTAGQNAKRTRHNLMDNLDSNGKKKKTPVGIPPTLIPDKNKF